jgi:hypothetical protein
MPDNNRPMWAHYAENLPAARAAGYDDDTLGPCGCRDYHMADCPTRTPVHDDAPDPGDYYDREDNA